MGSNDHMERHYSYNHISFIFQNGGLRSVKFDDTEMLRFLGFHVRDQNWATFDNQVTYLEWEKDTLRYSVLSTLDEYQYHWECLVTINDKTLKFEILGCAKSNFLSNRIGFVILHPSEFAGKPITIWHSDSSISEGRFPEMISPHQPFKNIIGMDWCIGSLKSELRMSGDIFEMEDQRNWLDASFKTYCTPLEEPSPIKTRFGDSVRQQITCQFSGKEVSTNQAFKIEFDSEPRVLPKFGLVLNHEALSDWEIKVLGQMAFHHFRLEMCTYLDEWEIDFDRKVSQIQQLQRPIELILYTDLKSMDEHLDYLLKKTEIIRWTYSFFVFDIEQDTADYQMMALAREKLKKRNPLIQFGLGTDFYFTQVNREPPMEADYDFLKFSANPQVHAFDDPSILESGRTFFDMGHTAFKNLSHGKPIHVSPVTFQKKLSPDSATIAGRVISPIEQTDTRLHAKIAALWVAKSIISMTNSGVKLATFFETVGPRGILDKSKVSPVGKLFTVLSRYGNYAMILSQSSHPSYFDAITFENGEDRVIVLINYEHLSFDLEIDSIHMNLPPFGIYLYDHNLEIFDQI